MPSKRRSVDLSRVCRLAVQDGVEREEKRSIESDNDEGDEGDEGDEYDGDDPFLAPEGTPSDHPSLDSGEQEPASIPQNVIDSYNNIREMVAEVFPPDFEVLEEYFRQAQL
jgi:hypothetical protein